MKKILLLAAMAMMGLQMQAQLVGSTMTMKRTEVVEVKETVDEKWGWNTFSFEYLATNFSTKMDGTYNGIYVSAEDSYTTSGFGFTYMRAISLTRNHKVPLYLEPGIGMEFYIGGDKSGNLKMLTAKIPLNFIYDIAIPNTSIHIDPYFGLRFRGNIIGNADRYYTNKYGTHKDEVDVFNKNDMGGSDYAFSHFQVGWQIGCKFRFSKFYLQLGWGTDFNNISKYTSTSQFQSAIGVAF